MYFEKMRKLQVQQQFCLLFVKMFYSRWLFPNVLSRSDCQNWNDKLFFTLKRYGMINDGPLHFVQKEQYTLFNLQTCRVNANFIDEKFMIEDKIILALN